MNPRFRSRVESFIQDAVRVYKEAKAENHPGLAGLVREIALEMLLRPLLPPEIGVGTGKIIDSTGGESKQIDIILHHAGILPAATYGDRFGLFPVESCFYAIEVKSTATSLAASQACDTARSIATLTPNPGFFATPKTLSEGKRILVPHKEGGGRFPNFGYFAFSTDLVPEGSQPREVERILTALGSDSHHKIHLAVICVVNSITSSWSRQKETWRHVAHSSAYDEVVYFLSSILNTVATMNVTRTPVNIGSYLWE